MTDRARELVEKAKWLREFAGGELVWCGRHAADERQALMSIADFIEQSLTPPEGDTVSDEVVEALKTTTVHLIAAISLLERIHEDVPRTKKHALFGSKIKDYRKAAEEGRAALQSRVSPQAPIPMLLYCPQCGLQHIDEPDERTPEWDNPPHRSHLCHDCGCVWRPADVPTNGVAAIETRGKADTWTAERGNAEHAVSPQAGMREALEGARDTLLHLDVESGYCCCGSPVEGHSIGDGHSPIAMNSARLATAAAARSAETRSRRSPLGRQSGGEAETPNPSPESEA